MRKLYSGYLDTADLEFAKTIAVTRRVSTSQVLREALHAGLRAVEARRLASASHPIEVADVA